MALAEEQLLNGKDLIGLEQTYGARNYLPLDVVIERAEGCWVYAMWKGSATWIASRPIRR
jgi:hypothetical protein